MAEKTTSVSKADADILNDAATALYQGASLPNGTAELVASILRAEAWFIDAMPALTELFAAAMEQVNGGKSTIAIARTEDGDIRVHGDNTTNALNLARLILNNR